MAESISFQNGNVVKSESNAEHEIKFHLNDNGSLTLSANITFPLNTANLKLNQTRLNAADFKLSEVEVILDAPVGKDQIAVYTTSTMEGLSLNIKVSLNANADKKYMFGAGEDKKWMFGN